MAQQPVMTDAIKAGFDVRVEDPLCAGWMGECVEALRERIRCRSLLAESVGIRISLGLRHRIDADGSGTRVPDEVIVEEPLSVRLDGHAVTTTMRTPGNDFELAVGLCFTDGLLAGAPVLRCRYCGEASAAVTEFNTVTVETGGRAEKERLAATLAVAEKARGELSARYGVEFPDFNTPPPRPAE